jgi:hypothetical protein
MINFKIFAQNIENNSYIADSVYDDVMSMAKEGLEGGRDDDSEQNVGRILSDDADFSDFLSIVPVDAAASAIVSGSHIGIIVRHADDMPPELKDISNALIDGDITPGESRVLVEDFLQKSADSKYDNRALLSELIAAVISTGILSTRVLKSEAGGGRERAAPGSQGVAKMIMGGGGAAKSGGSPSYMSPLAGSKKVRSYGWRYSHDDSSGKMNSSVRLAASSVKDITAVMDGFILDAGKNEEDGNYIKFVDINNYCHLFFNLGSIDGARKYIGKGLMVLRGDSIGGSSPKGMGGDSYMDWKVAMCSDDQDPEHVSFSTNVIDPESLRSFGSKEELALSGTEEAPAPGNAYIDYDSECNMNEIELIAFKLALKGVDSSKHLTDSSFDNLEKISNSFVPVGQYRILQETWEGRAVSDEEIDGVRYGSGSLLPEDRSWSHMVFGERNAARDIYNDEAVADLVIKDYYEELCDWRLVAIAWYAGADVVGTPDENSRDRISAVGSSLKFDSISGYANRVMANYRKNRENIIGRIDFDPILAIDKKAGLKLVCPDTSGAGTVIIDGNEMRAFKTAIRGIESGGVCDPNSPVTDEQYGVGNPDANSGTALGAYQIMNFNVYGTASKSGYWFIPSLESIHAQCDASEPPRKYYSSERAIPEHLKGCFEHRGVGEFIHNSYSWAYQHTGTRLAVWTPETQEMIADGAIRELYCRHRGSSNYGIRSDGRTEDLWVAIAIAWYAGEDDMGNRNSKRRYGYGTGEVFNRYGVLNACNIEQNDDSKDDFCYWRRTSGSPLRRSYSSIYTYSNKFLNCYQEALSALGGRSTPISAEGEEPQLRNAEEPSAPVGSENDCYYRDEDGFVLPCADDSTIDNDSIDGELAEVGIYTGDDMNKKDRGARLTGLFRQATESTVEMAGFGDVGFNNIPVWRGSSSSRSRTQLVPRKVAFSSNLNINWGIEGTAITNTEDSLSKNYIFQGEVLTHISEIWSSNGYVALQQSNSPSAEEYDLWLDFTLSNSPYAPGEADSLAGNDDSVIIKYSYRGTDGEDSATWRTRGTRRHSFETGKHYNAAIEAMKPQLFSTEEQNAKALAYVYTLTDGVLDDISTDAAERLFVVNGRTGAFYQ